MLMLLSAGMPGRLWAARRAPFHPAERPPHAAVRYARGWTVVLLQRGHNRQHRFDTARALDTLRAKTARAPQHPRPNRPFRGVVRRFYPFQAPESPQRWTHLENLPTDTLGCRMAAPGAGFQQPLTLPPHRGHSGAKTRPFARAITDPMPPVKHLVCLALQRLATLLGTTTPLAHGGNVAQQVRPPQLPPAHRIPSVGAETRGHQGALGLRAQQFLRGLTLHQAAQYT